MNASKLSTVERLAEELVARLTIELEASGRHVHLSRADGLTLHHGDRVLRLSRGLIVAKRHIHMTPEDAARFGVADRQRVRLQCFTSRPLVFQDVEVRVSPQFSTVVHIDYDEANACGFQKGDRGVILK